MSVPDYGVTHYQCGLREEQRRRRRTLVAKGVVSCRCDTLLPVKTVHLGEPATFTCVISNTKSSNRGIHWYKQSVGDSLNIIVTLFNSVTEYAPNVSKSRFDLRTDDSFSNLTILSTVEEDEGMYHCGVTEWIKSKWSGTYLLVEGNTERTVVQTVSDPVRPGDSVTLQCSVLSDSENKTCPGDLSVFWFRAGSQTSHPNIIYTDGDMSNKCEKRSETQKRCVYGFSKDVSSSDAGTYYCAVATCREILFGNGTKLEADQTASSVLVIVLVVAIICLAISMIINLIFICCGTQKGLCGQHEATKSSSSPARQDDVSQPVKDKVITVTHIICYFTSMIPNGSV
ncbi:signal-regulatory protein beta-2-like [Mugil cephalus]|uniref:signal-regulatory protein beta-2-like n=1 Tax=Mugil cephalus TaxID=48193 RepID=UPI001FB5E5D0|nr:signal-regulatory protein beta-2-like [Mugil cephalus]